MIYNHKFIHAARAILNYYLIFVKLLAHAAWQPTQKNQNFFAWKRLKAWMKLQNFSF